MLNKSFWKNKKVLITGHTGFKGSWLSSVLSLYNCKLYGFSLKPKSKDQIYVTNNIKSLFIDEKFSDINNFNILNSFIKKIKPEIIFHLAAQSLVLQSYKDPNETFLTNVMGTLNLCESVKNQKQLKSLVIVTSDKCYLNKDKKIHFFNENDPLGGYDPYSASKAGTELVTQLYQKTFFSNENIKCSSVRAGNVIGGGDVSKDRIFTDIINAFKKNKVLSIRSPNSYRPWQHVLEPISGYILLAQNLFNDKKNKFVGPWNFGPNKSNIKTVLNIVKLVNKEKKIKYSKSKKNNFYESKYLALDIRKAKKMLKWKPKLNIQQTIKWTVDWYLAKDKSKITYKQIESFFNL